MPIITLGLNSNETTGKNHVFEYWTKISEKYKLNIEMANKTIILTASVNQTFSGGFIYPPESNGSNEIYFLAPLDYSKENLFAHGILPDGITQCKTITGDIPYHDTDENETTLKVKDYILKLLCSSTAQNIKEQKYVCYRISEEFFYKFYNAIENTAPVIVIRQQTLTGSNIPSRDIVKLKIPKRHRRCDECF